MISVPTYTAQIYVGLREGYAGEVHTLEEAKSICQDYVNEVKLCVTVTPTEFVYVGNSEPGVIIGLINYPRFPSTPEKIEAHAIALAEHLKTALGQNRVSIVLPDRTVLLGDL